MKILYVTTVGGTMGFFKSIIKELIEEGNQVDVATNESDSQVPVFFRELGCRVFSISTSRSIFRLGNFRAIRQIKNIAKFYDIVHCHTPIASFVTRLGCKKLRKKGLKVIYTAHGFHFYKGAPIRNWICFYPVELLCSRWTDALITINQEDYELSKKKMKTKSIFYIPGVGIDTTSFLNVSVDKSKFKEELGLPSNAFIYLSVGELNSNKNHQLIIKALGEINNSNIHYLIAGTGDKKEYLSELAQKLNVNLHLLGYRKDVQLLYKIADIYTLPSIREGLNVSIMEAIASGCPVVASKIRGNTDLVSLDNCFDIHSLNDVINKISKSTIKNKEIVCQIDYKTINRQIKDIYNSFYEDKFQPKQQ